MTRTFDLHSIGRLGELAGFRRVWKQLKPYPAKTVRLVLIVAAGWLASGASEVNANDLYLAQTAAGAADGSSCANAYAYTYSNSLGNWTQGTPAGTQIGPGSTMHICGTWTGAVSQWFLAPQGSGTAGNPITYLFEPNAVIQAPYFDAAGAINLNGKNYITVDGGINGIMRNTLNGTPGAMCLGGPCSYQQSTRAIQGNASSNIVIQNLTIADLYIHTSVSDTVVNAAAVDCFYDNGTSSNIIIRNNTMHDTGWCLEFQYGNSTNMVISGNNIYNMDHGIAFGGAVDGLTLNGVAVYGNNIHDYSNWDTTANAYHHDGIHIWGHNDNASDTIENVGIYSNTFGGCVGFNVTAHIFMEANLGGTKATSIYNNTLIDTCSGNDLNGLMTLGNMDGPYSIYNNTAIGTAGDTCFNLGATVTPFFINNVSSGCATLLESVNSFAANGLSNNVYAGSGATGNLAFKFAGTFYSNSQLAGWQSATGQDVNSIYVSSALLNSNGSPQSGSAVSGVGRNLTDLGVAALNSDIIGVPRPSAGSWTVGAYAPPAPPTMLSVLPR